MGTPNSKHGEVTFKTVAFREEQWYTVGEIALQIQLYTTGIRLSGQPI